jgi:hypothetical protein
MKRALTAAVVGGLMAFVAPQAAFADHDHGKEATGPEGTAPEPDRGPPQGHPYGDREQHDDEEGTILF